MLRDADRREQRRHDLRSGGRGEREQDGCQEGGAFHLFWPWGPLGIATKYHALEHVSKTPYLLHVHLEMI